MRLLAVLTQTRSRVPAVMRRETRDLGATRRVRPCGPGSRLSLLTLVGAQREAVAAYRLNLTMSNSAVLFVPAARCCARVGLFPFAPDPEEGWAERRQAHYLCCRVCETRRSARVRRGASHDAGRSPLGAPPWRFSAGGRASISGISSGSVQRAPRSQVVMPGGRCPGPPEPAVTSRGRRTPLPAPPFRIVSGRRPSMSEDGNLCTINSLRSQ